MMVPRWKLESVAVKALANKRTGFTILDGLEWALDDVVISGFKVVLYGLSENDLDAQLFNWIHTGSDSTLSEVDISIESYSLSDSITSPLQISMFELSPKNLGLSKIILEYSVALRQAHFCSG